MPLPHYPYSYDRYKRNKIKKRMESVERLFSVFISKKYTEDVDKHSR
jgi:hypothetical protein